VVTTWRQEFIEAFEETNDNFDNLVCTLTDEELDIEFNNGFGVEEGKPFTAWSENFVYFPVRYDGSEWIAWVSRNPDNKPTAHIGGS